MRYGRVCAHVCVHCSCPRKSPPIIASTLTPHSRTLSKSHSHYFLKPMLAVQFGILRSHEWSLWRICCGPMGERSMSAHILALIHIIFIIIPNATYQCKYPCLHLPLLPGRFMSTIKANPAAMSQTPALLSVSDRDQTKSHKILYYKPQQDCYHLKQEPNILITQGSLYSIQPMLSQPHLNYATRSLQVPPCWYRQTPRSLVGVSHFMSFTHF